MFEVMGPRRTSEFKKKHLGFPLFDNFNESQDKKAKTIYDADKDGSGGKRMIGSANVKPIMYNTIDAQ